MIILRSLLFPLLLLPLMVHSQGAEPFVDHWDAKKTIKKSEGLMVNGREWGEWKFYDDRGVLARTVIYDSTGTMIGPGDKSSQRPH